MHEIREGMCCFATERDRRWGQGWGEAWSHRGEDKRRDKPAKEKSREKEWGEKLTVVTASNESGEQDSIVSDVFLFPNSLVIHKIIYAYKSFGSIFEEYNKGAVLHPGY